MNHKNKIATLILSVLLCLGCFCIIRALFVYRGIVQTLVIGAVQEKVIHLQSPALFYMNENKATATFSEVGMEMVKEAALIYPYSDGYPNTALGKEDADMIEQLIISEGRDEEAAQDENSISTTEPEMTAGAAKAEDDAVNTEEADAVEESGQTEDEEQTLAAVETEPVQPAALKDFDTLLSKYYVLDGTMIDESQLNITKLLSYDMKLKQADDKEKPQILIYHTHSQEAFIDSDPSNEATTIMGAGEKLADALRGYGFTVLHHMGKYDMDSRDYAYSLAGPAIEKVLSENPSIEVVIDLHRDGVLEDTHMTTQIGGQTMAQFMFFNGLSRTKTRGDIEYLKNENIDENLAFSFQAQLMAEKYYPGLARRIYLKGYRYNMHFKGKTLLIELGAQTNTVEEVLNAVGPIAHILNLTLKGEE